MDLLAHDGVASDRAANLALEEALARAQPQSPLLRTWQNECCLVLGRGQHVSREVNLAACAAAGIPVLRRASGGGTVYQDLGNLNITLAVPGPAPGLVAELAALVVSVIARLGLPATAGERGVFVNGVTRRGTASPRGEQGPAGGATVTGPASRAGEPGPAGGAKVSGLASQVTRTGSVAHATLLVTTAASRVQAFLSPAPADSHPTDSRRSRVASLRELGCELGVAEARGAVLAEAAWTYGPLSRRPPNDGELGWQRRLLAERYRIDSWHQTGRTEEAQWTTRPVLTCTG
jgi:lipoate-protein ligase A